MHLLTLLASSSAQEELIRVDVPDHPDAIATSEYGSVLASPPADLPWRPEPIPVTDVEPMGAYQAWEAIDALGVEPWHAAGFDGSGVKIAVFDLEWYGAELRSEELGDFTTHDCYVQRSCASPIDTIHPTFSFESGSHGVACAELIRDIAPGAELHLVRVNGLTTLENAVAWAIREEVDLISMSLSFFNESFYDGTGAINAQMELLAAAGISMVTSAGNYADQHYQDDFTDADGDGLHDFPWGDRGLPIYLEGGWRRIYLTWNQHRTCGLTDLDAYVYDSEGMLVGRSTEEQVSGADGCFPGERITARADGAGWYYLQVHHRAGVSQTRIDVMARGGELYQPDPRGSIADPGTAEEVLTVGAIRALHYRTADVEDFSSQGPTSSGLYKPDIAGPDGVSSFTYGPTGFYGTSAATPAVAASIALIMSREPALSPQEATDRLLGWALPPLDQATWDAPSTAMGAGRAHLPDPDTLGGCAGHLMLLVLPLGALRRASRQPVR